MICKVLSRECPKGLVDYRVACEREANEESGQDGARTKQSRPLCLAVGSWSPAVRSVQPDLCISKTACAHIVSVRLDAVW
jgi:hypothetical protein